jgi:hypothetical protein
MGGLFSSSKGNAPKTAAPPSRVTEQDKAVLVRASAPGPLASSRPPSVCLCFSLVSVLLSLSHVWAWAAPALASET